MVETCAKIGHLRRILMALEETRYCLGLKSTCSATMYQKIARFKSKNASISCWVMGVLGLFFFILLQFCEHKLVESSRFYSC